jgi:CheY-like chemotaxis protein
VKGLAELHGGSVEADSKGLGRGSRFTVRLPAAEAPENDRQPDSQEGDKSVFRILIVEDNVDAAESLNVLLHLVGHTVATAHNGQDAIAKAREFQPDVVLCDIGLPDGMDGYQVARALRADAATGNPYLIALTGYGQEEDLAKAKLSGFDLHLTKPVDPAALRRLLSGPLRSSGTGTLDFRHDMGSRLSLQ